MHLYQIMKNYVKIYSYYINHVNLYWYYLFYNYSFIFMYLENKGR